MKISILATVALDNIIGFGDTLPWWLPADKRRFNALTAGRHVLMGRKTYEALSDPLAGRKLLVLSNTLVGSPRKGVQIVSSLWGAIRIAALHGERELFIIGGESVFKEAIEHTHKMYLTKVHAEVDGDKYFPEFRRSEWNMLSAGVIPANEENKHPLSWRVYNRKAA